MKYVRYSALLQLIILFITISIMIVASMAGYYLLALWMFRISLLNLFVLLFRGFVETIVNGTASVIFGLLFFLFLGSGVVNSFAVENDVIIARFKGDN